MAKTVIKFGLSVREIDRAIKELEQYKQELIRKIDLLREKVAQRIASLAQSGFSGAIVDDLLPESGGARQAEVTVSLDQRDNVTVVVAQGEDAIWVEFGAGVYHNKGYLGSSPNPFNAENDLGFTIGGFGTNGDKEVWGFYEDPNDKKSLRLTHGTPAVMPMYNAVQTVCDEIVDIAREVFQ